MLKQLRNLAYTPSALGFMDRVESKVPGLRAWHRAQYRRHFDKYYKWERLFHGVYPTRAAALAEIPRGRPVGYDNPETATFLGSCSPMLPGEYPILFWLSKLLSEDAHVFDLGGYLGLSYNWYRPFDIYPEDLLWSVYDVPAVVGAGLALLEQDPNPQLHFTCDFSDAAAAGVLLASGSLQFCEEPFAGMLATLTKLPKHLLLNKLPLTCGEPFFTLNNMGPAISVYKVERRVDFIAGIQALGYELIDEWKNPELGCFIAFHPEATIDGFDGLYFKRK